VEEKQVDPQEKVTPQSRCGVAFHRAVIEKAVKNKEKEEKKPQGGGSIQREGRETD